MADAITLPARITAAVPTDLAEAVRRTAAARGLTSADYLRGAVQTRLLLDGARFDRLPNLQRLASRSDRLRNF